MHDTDALDETKHAAVDGEIENTSSHDEDTEYEYETTEYYVVASLPPRAIARASEAANDSKGVSARLSHATRTNQTVSDRSSDIDEEPNEPTIGRRNGRPQQPQYALIDVETDKPMLELEGTIYMGCHEELLGTHLLFDIDAEDDLGSEKSSVEVLGYTSKTILFHPVKMTKKLQ